MLLWSSPGAQSQLLHASLYPCVHGPAQGCVRREGGEGGGSGSHKKWPKSISPFVSFMFSHREIWSWGGGVQEGVPPPLLPVVVTPGPAVLSGLVLTRSGLLMGTSVQEPRVRTRSTARGPWRDECRRQAPRAQRQPRAHPLCRNSARNGSSPCEPRVRRQTRAHPHPRTHVRAGTHAQPPCSPVR